MQETAVPPVSGPTLIDSQVRFSYEIQKLINVE